MQTLINGAKMTKPTIPIFCSGERLEKITTHEPGGSLETPEALLCSCRGICLTMQSFDLENIHKEAITMQDKAVAFDTQAPWKNCTYRLNHFAQMYRIWIVGPETPNQVSLILTIVCSKQKGRKHRPGLRCAQPKRAATRFRRGSAKQT